MQCGATDDHMAQIQGKIVIDTYGELYKLQSLEH